MPHSFSALDVLCCDRSIRETNRAQLGRSACLFFLGGRKTSPLGCAPRGAAENKANFITYSLRGSNPQPMAHKTIAPTTELRELLGCILARGRGCCRTMQFSGSENCLALLNWRRFALARHLELSTLRCAPRGSAKAPRGAAKTAREPHRGRRAKELLGCKFRLLPAALCRIVFPLWKYCVAIVALGKPIVPSSGAARVRFLLGWGGKTSPWAARRAARPKTKQISLRTPCGAQTRALWLIRPSL